MAAEDEGKTEEPTERKLQDARKDGDVPKSQDLSSATISLCGVLATWMLQDWFKENISLCLYRFIREEMAEETIPQGKEIVPYLIMALQYTFYIITPFLLIILVVAVGVNIYQVGLQVSTKPLELDFNKLNPVKGLQNLFSMQKLVMLGQNILKLALAFAVAYPLISDAFAESGLLTMLMPAASATYCANSALEVAFRVALVLFILSLFDRWYQKYKFMDKMKMTKEEIKDEMRSMEGDPQVKSKRRQKMMEMSRNRMMKEIPDADVVVRNPTHYAVALKYTADMAAPTVVAKGKNKIAEKILELAKESRIPLWQDPWLARELYKLELGQPIPPELFAATVNILKNVWTAEKQAEVMRAAQERQTA